jgi:hypothetical protein
VGASRKISFAGLTRIEESIADLEESVVPFQALPDVENLWFKSIPPERIGLNGEYDYYGLAKRVRCHLRQRMGAIVTALKIHQRGRVIVFSGYLPPAVDLNQVVKLTLMVHGVDAVETQGIILVEPRKAIPA